MADMATGMLPLPRRRQPFLVLSVHRPHNAGHTARRAMTTTMIMAVDDDDDDDDDNDDDDKDVDGGCGGMDGDDDCGDSVLD